MLGGAASEVRAAYQFELASPTGGTWVPGAGYGNDGSNENGGTLLDVFFDIDPGVAGASQLLSIVGQTWDFTFGTIQFKEPNTGSGANQGIKNPNELDALSVTANFHFVSPLNSVVQQISVSAVATPGPITDSPEAVDYTLDFDPITIGFGSGGSFKIELGLLASGLINPFSFSTLNQTQTATARITLLQEPTNGGNQGSAVPEPTSMALAGFAGIGMAISAIRRRRQSKAEAA